MFFLTQLILFPFRGVKLNTHFRKEEVRVFDESIINVMMMEHMYQLLRRFDLEGRDTMCLLAGWALIVARAASGPRAGERVSALQKFCLQANPDIVWVEQQVVTQAPDWIRLWHRHEEQSIAEALRCVNRTKLASELRTDLQCKTLGPELPLELLQDWHRDNHGWARRSKMVEAFERVQRHRNRCNGFVLHCAWAKLMKTQLKELVKMLIGQRTFPASLIGISLEDEDTDGRMWAAAPQDCPESQHILPEWVLRPLGGEVTPGGGSSGQQPSSPSSAEVRHAG